MARRFSATIRGSWPITSHNANVASHGSTHRITIANNEQRQNVLVVGGDGLLGRHTHDRLDTLGLQPWSTTRRSVRAQQRTSLLDLSLGPEQWLLPTARFDVAIFCVGITSIDACAADPTGTRRINVSQIIRLGQLLAARRTRLIYLSTDAVFDGTTRQPPIEMPTNATSEYGRQMADCEAGLLKLEGSAAVVRLGKVIPPQMPLFSSWVDALRNGEPIHPITNRLVAPISLDAAVERVIDLVVNPTSGIFHFTAAEDMTYIEAASWFANNLGVSPSLVRPVDSKSSVAQAFERRYVALKNDHDADRFGATGFDALETVL